MGFHRIVNSAQSLSSWRAWIEIISAPTMAKCVTSLSSWRAWIEIALNAHTACSRPVALLMESVD